MAISINTTYRIKRNGKQEAQMKYLSQELRVFHSYDQILMLSAIIGFNNNAFCPIETAASDSVQIINFSEKDLDIMELIIFAYKKEQSILNSDEKYHIFESLANGGFPILVEKLGIDWVNKEKNDRLTIMKRLLLLLIRSKF